MPTTILLAHCLDLALIGAQHVLDADPDHQVVASVSNLSQLRHALPNHQPQVVILNHFFSPDADVFEIMSEIRLLVPVAKIIITGSVLDGLFVRDVLHAGSDGYLWDQDALSECLIPAVRTVMKNRPYLSATANAEYLVAMQSPLRDWHLDCEARNVLRLLAQGCHVYEIATALNVTPRRIYWVRQKLRDRFGADTNEQLIAIAAGEGFIYP